MTSFVLWMIATAFSCELHLVKGARDRPHVARATFEDYCKEQGASFFGAHCTCDDSEAVCQKGDVVGCGAGNAEKKKFSMGEWENEEAPKCVPDICLTEKQAKLTYDGANSRWICECSNPNAHCFSGQAHCPFEAGLQFPKQFLTTCDSCICRISPAKKFWSTGKDEYKTLCSKGAAIFDAKESLALGELTCNCAAGKHAIIDGKSFDTFNPSTCPDCTCISPDSDNTHYQTLGLDADASASDIEKAYRRAARRTHPDVNPDDDEATAKFIAVSEAFQVLSDPATRERYDKCRACGLWVAPEEGGRIMQYAITTPRDTEDTINLLIKVYKTRPDAVISEDTLRSGEDAVELACSKYEIQESVGEVLNARLELDKSALLCTGTFEYKRSRHGIFALAGQQTTQMTIQLIARGTKEDPAIYVKETRDGEEDGRWHHIVAV